MSKIPRVQQVAMSWLFGDYNNEVYRNEPVPPAITGLGSPELLTILTKVTAMLGGKEGEIEFSFTVPANKHKFFAEDELRARMYQAVDDQLLPNIRVGLVVTSKQGDFSFSFKFSPQSGEPFTATAARGFVEVAKRLLGPESLKILPIPQVSSRTFWRIGEEKLSFGVAVALDIYMDGGFRRIQRVFEAEGAVAAGRLCHRLCRALVRHE